MLSESAAVSEGSTTDEGAVRFEGAVPAGLDAAVLDYERALMQNDLEALDRFFAPGADTVRGDAAGILVGHDAISRFRVGRGGAPRRRLLRVLVRAVGDDDALAIAVFAPTGGGRGQQTQLWRRDPGGWVITAAHVSGPPLAVDGAVWRTVGTPLVRGAADVAARPASERDPVPPAPVSRSSTDPVPPAAGLPLAGLRAAVKDLFAVAGHPIGAGVPEWLAEATPESVHAAAVRVLLDAGADVTGIARTDEFAYSIGGRNAHYGSPPNPAVVGGIPGGSSSGPASAVALGQVHIGLGTDTGGSVRVPASYQGLWGIRTTHGAVDRTGLLPLAPSFDTVGWLTRDAATLRAVAAVGLARPGAVRLAPADADADADAGADARANAALDGRGLGPRFVVAPAVTALADRDVQGAMRSFLSAAVADGRIPTLDEVELPDADVLFEAFRTVQAAEAWRVHGRWVTAHPGALGDEIAARFAWASGFGEHEERDARILVEESRSTIERQLDGRILLLPSASSAAPQVSASAEENELTRARTLRLTCIAGILGAPAVSAPLLHVAAGPVGLCLIGPRGSDLALIDTAALLEG